MLGSLRKERSFREVELGLAGAPVEMSKDDPVVITFLLLPKLRMLLRRVLITPTPIPEPKT